MTGLSTLADPTTMTPIIDRILADTVAGKRLSAADALVLLQSPHLASIGRAANAVTARLHPEPYRTYNIDRNINYTNVCTAVCDFCAFYRPPKHAEGYVLDREVLMGKIAEMVSVGGDQILLQGGLHPTLELEWYEDLLRDIKARFPQVNVHGFSPPEIHHFTKISKRPLREVLERLARAGLGSLPGGGGEILVDRVRKEITRGKVLTDDWLNVMRVWHELGGRSTATMMFGHLETVEERIEHLEVVRAQQDVSLQRLVDSGRLSAGANPSERSVAYAEALEQGRLNGGAFTAFIAWTFQPENTVLKATTVGSHEYLRMQALARIYLDNIPSVQSSWVTQGPEVGQVALLHGANDLGSIMIEENVVSSAGTTFRMGVSDMKRLISELGFEPVQRDNWYRPVVPLG